MSSPQYGERSPDGYYWWDGTTWQTVEQGGAQNAEHAPNADAGGVLAKVNDPSEIPGHFQNAMDAAEGQAQELEA